MGGVQEVHGRCTGAAWKVCGQCAKGAERVFLRSSEDKKSGFYVNKVVISVMSLAVVGTIGQSEIS